MKNIILSTAIIGTLLFATPAYGDPPKKTVVINMINIDAHEHNEDKKYITKKYGKTWKVFIPNAEEVPSNHAHNGFEKPMNSNEDFRFQPCDE